jgi:hypothetical protein
VFSFNLHSECGSPAHCRREMLTQIITEKWPRATSAKPCTDIKQVRVYIERNQGGCLSLTGCSGCQASSARWLPMKSPRATRSPSPTGSGPAGVPPPSPSHTCRHRRHVSAPIISKVFRSHSYGQTA